MSSVPELIKEYESALELPWQAGISGAERVWMLVYPPHDERRIRARLDQFRDHTRAAHRDWRAVDLTDAVGRWVGHSPDAEAFFHDPTDLTDAVLEDAEASVAEAIRSSLTDPGLDDDGVVALVGVGSLYPYLRASRVIQSVEDDIRGRMLVLFPGHVDRVHGNYRLLDARDGFSYRARLIAEKELP